MSTAENQEVEVLDPLDEEEEVEYGPGRQSGSAGPDAGYIMASLDRWRLRGDGLLQGK